MIPILVLKIENKWYIINQTWVSELFEEFSKDPKLFMYFNSCYQATIRKPSAKQSGENFSKWKTKQLG